MLNVETSDLTNTPHAKKHELIPDFLIIGAGKCGTTSLFRYLKQHPDIFIPALREPNFYGYENKSPKDFGEGLADATHFQESVTSFPAYINLFKEALPGQLKGEMSNSYMYHDQAPERIKYYNPHMKLIAILRQPAGRLYSRFLHLARESRLPTGSFSECVKRDSIWWKRNDLIKEGFYYKNLKRYFDLFPRENIRIYLYEDLNEEAPRVLRDIFEFLEVNPNFQPDLNGRFNESGIIKNKFLNRIYGQKGLISRSLKTLLPLSVVERLEGNIHIQKMLSELRKTNLAKPKPDPAIMNWLTHEVYASDIKQLQVLIKRDLSHWLKPRG